MATQLFGRLDSFDGGKDDWPLYKEQLEQYFVANKVADDDRKRAILLSACGSNTYEVIRNLVTLAKPADKSFKEICDLLREHFNPTPPEIV